MSIIKTGLDVKLYEEALDDIEYKSSALWQHVLRQSFPDTNTYVVAAESSPDGSLRRVDMVVRRYDPHHHTISAILWVECKRPSGSAQEVEDQALDAAWRCMEIDGLMWMWAMTTIGVSFRMWFVSRDRRELVAVDGAAASNDKTQYIDANSAAAGVFFTAIQNVKDGTPLRVPRIVPSQSLDMSGTAVASLPGWAAGQSGHDNTETGPSGSGGGGGGEVGSRDHWVEAKVRKVSHTLAHDEYVFRDVKGGKRSTRKEDWEVVENPGGKKLWVFRGRKTTYFSLEEIS